MKVCHWSLTNGSGMHRVAESIANAEKAMGLDSSVVDCQVESEAWKQAIDADIHVAHTHVPNVVRKTLKPGHKIVWVAHGTPDHVFQSSVEAGLGAPYGHGDAMMLMQYWLRNADARVTFWPRHQWIYQRMVDRGTQVHCIPLGVDKAFWSAGVSRGKYEGTPSLFTAENPHYIKWPYDLFTLWPDVFDQLDGAKLHAIYVPRDMHRWIFPWINANGCAYGSHISPITFPHDELRNVFKSIDFFIGLVRYGDFNQLSMQANASGAKTISYAGNPYSDFWITEGDQRVMASELTAILKGQVAPRTKLPVPDLADTASAMLYIYESIVSWNGSTISVPTVTTSSTPKSTPRRRGARARSSGTSPRSSKTSASDATVRLVPDVKLAEAV